MPEPADMPLVSIIVPSYNHEAYVEQAIHSVLAQTYPRIELIAIDDASTDGTAAVLERLSNEFDFTFVRNESNSGVNATAIKAWTMSRGSLVAGLASDDVIAPDKIERQVRHLQATGADGVFSTGYKLAEDGSIELIDMDHVERKFRDGSILDYVYCNDTSVPLFQSGLFKREAVIDLFPYRYQFKSDDWIFLIKLIEQYKIDFLNEPLFYYRQHPENSYRRYWATFPMRLEVISRATPERLRGRAVANLLFSQAQYLFFDGKKALALRFLAASVAMHPSPTRMARLGGAVVRSFAKRARRTMSGKSARSRPRLQAPLPDPTRRRRSDAHG